MGIIEFDGHQQPINPGTCGGCVCEPPDCGCIELPTKMHLTLQNLSNCSGLDGLVVEINETFPGSFIWMSAPTIMGTFNLSCELSRGLTLTMSGCPTSNPSRNYLQIKCRPIFAYWDFYVLSGDFSCVAVCTPFSFGQWRVYLSS